jgi:hypothetical protein
MKPLSLDEEDSLTEICQCLQLVLCCSADMDQGSNRRLEPRFSRLSDLLVSLLLACRILLRSDEPKGAFLPSPLFIGDV